MRLCEVSKNSMLLMRHEYSCPAWFFQGLGALDSGVIAGGEATG